MLSAGVVAGIYREKQGTMNTSRDCAGSAQGFSLISFCEDGLKTRTEKMLLDTGDQGT